MSLALYYRRTAVAICILSLGFGITCYRVLSGPPDPSLPLTPRLPTGTYPGREPGARWRNAALARIDKFRKADMRIRVLDAMGNPVVGAKVKIHLLRQAFRFGTATSAVHLLGKTSDDGRYRRALKENFNYAVPGNDLKWDFLLMPGYGARVAPMMKWLKDNGFPVKGHNLVWPGWRFLPAGVHNIAGDKKAVRRMVDEHLRATAGLLKGQLYEWDVVNEPDQNHDLMDILGPESEAGWFKTVHQVDPGSKLILNESVGPVPGWRTDRFTTQISGLLAQGAPLDGFGFQSHFANNLPAPADVVATLQRFGKFGKAINISEFDFKTADKQLQADFTRDFMIAAYSEPAVQEFMAWGFWDGDHWRNDAPLYNRDWSVKPSGHVWQDLVLHQWRTNTAGSTNAQGEFTARGFLGDYEVTVSRRGHERRVPLTLTPAGRSSTVVLQSP